MDIVCRVGGLAPHVVVIVATVRALAITAAATGARRRLAMRPRSSAGWRTSPSTSRTCGRSGSSRSSRSTRGPTTSRSCSSCSKLALEAGAFGAAIHNGFGQGGEGTIELAEVVSRRPRASPNFYAALRGRRADRDQDREDRDDGLRRETGSSSRRPRSRRSPATRSRGSPTCRSAWRRRTSRSRTTRRVQARRRASRPDPRHPRLLGRRHARAALRRHAADARLRRPAGAFAIDIDEDGETVGLF